MSEYNLERFLDAQGNNYDRALAEIQSGKKRSHWMWFIFPQLKGLGRSMTSDFYGIESLDEAKAFLEHPILGSRLREISEALLTLPDGLQVTSIFGSPDWMKLRSSMTLFDAVSPNVVFDKVLDRYFNGRRCSRTLSMLNNLR